MTARWRQLSPAESDHERIWGWVVATSALLGLAWLERVGSPPLVCPFRALTGWPCPTCGMTRAMVALLGGDLAGSLRLNPIVPPAVCVMALYVPYAIVVAHLSLPRLRVRLDVRDWTVLRWVTGAGALALWLFLIADGR